MRSNGDHVTYVPLQQSLSMKYMREDIDEHNHTHHHNNHAHNIGTDMDPGSESEDNTSDSGSEDSSIGFYVSDEEDDCEV